MTKCRRSISVVIPAYNEISLIATSTSVIARFLEENFDDHEIIIVESGSTDGTREACDTLAADLPFVTVIHENRRNGYGSALKLGYRGASKELVWPVAPDLPFALGSILQALPLLDNHACVLSYRSEDRRALSRRICSIAYNVVVKLTLSLRVRHVNSAFKVFRRSVIQAMPLESSGWFIDAEILWRLKKANIPCAEMPVALIDRSAGTSSVRISGGLIALKELLRFLTRTRWSRGVPAIRQ